MTKCCYIMRSAPMVSPVEIACKGSLGILVTALGTGQYSVQGLAFCLEGRPSPRLLSPEDYLSPSGKVYFSSAAEKRHVEMLKVLLLSGYRRTKGQRAIPSHPWVL